MEPMMSPAMAPIIVIERVEDGRIKLTLFAMFLFAHNFWRAPLKDPNSG